MEKTKAYKNVVYNHDRHEIRCNETELSPLYEDLIENATITFNHDGTITLEGDCVEWGVLLYDIHPSELDYEVDPKYIEKTRFLKRDIVRAGWHRKVEKKPIKITLNDFVIIEN